MIEKLRGEKLQRKDIMDGNIYILKKNQPKKIYKKDNDYIARIDEELQEGEKESLFVHSSFLQDECAIIANEFCLNALKNPKKVDLEYIFFVPLNKKVKVYLYDMKKTFAGIHTIFDLIEQWKCSIIDAENLVNELDDYEIESIQIGVITEEDDVARRKREIGEIFEKEKIPSNMPSFMKYQWLADHSDTIAKAKILHGFLEGKVMIRKQIYHYDVRKFVNKKYDMYFDNGVIRKDEKN